MDSMPCQRRSFTRDHSGGAGDTERSMSQQVADLPLTYSPAATASNGLAAIGPKRRGGRKPHGATVGTTAQPKAFAMCTIVRSVGLDLCCKSCEMRARDTPSRRARSDCERP